ncbi:16S rRNA (uracil(1498)-N(3))-methyltransferase [Bacillus ginsengihumi]|uniref:Ribosomal RNA small subunit methyltransferase E n=1 Tax=Heyndrickxia ginsengihumi TaxID=363870 RepID=A0A0A6VCA3_9BACI|nr:16S rRNA (uracil(1498)-N(3))-methyltransferase [Heyndrickxia ginsengihumi]KHD85206.1 16S rRNA methyltransferase [Heyndrickxia ginsengihumi]NEY19711.1 16S rRNA (uracil(1498)-N(3))-methyltransferase [Heyndrickxia ginsengihumi]
MQRYFLTKPYENEKEVRLQNEQYHHIVRVLRMEQGDRFYIVFRNEKACICEIKEITNEEVVAAIIEWEDISKELPVKVTIASGLPKGDKLEWIIQKATELGAYEFAPFIANRSIVKWDEKKGLKKKDRWQKIALEAAEQSHRQHVPLIHTPCTFKELLALSKSYEHKLVAFEEDAKQGESHQFVQALSQVKDGEKMLLVFGPEGGLSAQEVEQLCKAGFQTCGLGPRILRTETAPLYTLAAISYHLELMR